MIKKRNILLSLALSAIFTVGATDFNTTLSALASQSPALRASEAKGRLAALEAGNEATLPDPEIEAEHLWGADSSTKWNAGVAWNLEWPGLYAAKANRAKAVAASEDARLKAESKSLRNAAGQLLVEYAAASRRLKVINELLAATDSIDAIVKAGIRENGLTLLDGTKINIERGLLLAKQQEEEHALSQAKAGMAELCGLETEAILGDYDGSLPADPGYTKEYYLGRIASTPDMLLADTEIALAKAEGKIARREALPGLTVGYIHAYEEETHFNGGRLGLSIPLFSGKNKKKTAEAMRLAAEAEAENTRQALTSQVSVYCDRLTALRKSLAELQPVFTSGAPHALLLKAYTLQKLSLLEYLQERNYYMEAELDYISLKADEASLLLTLSNL